MLSVDGVVEIEILAEYTYSVVLVRDNDDEMDELPLKESVEIHQSEKSVALIQPVQSEVYRRCSIDRVTNRRAVYARSRTPCGVPSPGAQPSRRPTHPSLEHRLRFGTLWQRLSDRNRT